MDKPKIAAARPAPVELKAGQEIYWCACGRSQNQPYCDGSHQGTEFSPTRFVAEKDDKYFFCQCKRSTRPPFCDGSHKAITQEELDTSA
ncbi:MAG: CDGSH iron-sulfur domain-containing protein [Pseudomonadota bacterium]